MLRVAALLLALALGACGSTPAPRPAPHVAAAPPEEPPRAMPREEGCTVDGWCRVAPDALPVFDAVWEDEHGAWAISDRLLLRADGDRWLDWPDVAPAHLRAVWASGPRDVVVVGDGGTILRFDGRRFVAEASGVREDLLAVWGAGPSEVYAGGRSTSVLAWDGDAWTELHRDRAGQGMVVGFFGRRGAVHAVTAGGAILRRAEEGFEEVARDLGPLWSVAPLDDGGALLVGERGVQRYTPEAGASPLEVPSAHAPASVAASGARVWIGTRGGTVLLGDGASWTEEETGLGGSVRLARGRLGIAHAGSGVARFDGARFRARRRHESVTDAHLAAIWRRGEALYAAGSRGVVLTGGEDGWRALERGRRDELNAVLAVAPDDAWIVGERGLVLHWDGSAWGPIESGVEADLHGVWASGADDVWIVGEGGAVLRGGASGLARLEAPGGVALHAVHGSSERHVWIVGEGGTVLRWTGGGFDRLAVPGGRDLHAVFVQADNDAYVGGRDQPLLRFDGASFHEIDLPGAEDLAGAADLTARGAGAVIVASEHLALFNGRAVETLERHAGGARTELRGVWSHGSRVFGAGSAGPDHIGWVACAPACDRALWRPPTYARLNDVHGTSERDLWVVGELGTILRWDGSRWTDHTGGTRGDLVRFWIGEDGQAIGIAHDGSLLHFDGERFFESHADRVADVVATSARDAVAVGPELLRFDGTAWSRMGAGYGSRAARAPDGTILAISLDRYEAFFWDGASWASAPSPRGPPLRAVLSIGPREFLAVGGGGRRLRFGADGWREDTDGVRSALASVWARADGELWVAGGDRALARGRAGALEPVQAPEDPLAFDAVVEAGGALFLVSDLGQGVFRRDGDAWTSVFRDYVDASSVGADGALWIARGPVVRRLHGADVADVPSAPGYATTTAVWASSRNDVYLATSSRVSHFDGARWTDVWSGPLSGWNDAIFGTGPRDVWVLNSSASVHYDGSAWTEVDLDLPGRVTSVSASAADDVWIATATSELVRWDGAQATRVSCGVRERLRGVHVTARGEGWAVGDAGVLARFADGRCEPADDGLRADLDLLHAAADGAHALGAGGAVRWDGTAWQRVPIDVDAPLLAASGREAPVAVGEHGAVARYDGGRWRGERSGTSATLRGVLAQGDTAWAVGDRGTILRWRASHVVAEAP